MFRCNFTAQEKIGVYLRQGIYKDSAVDAMMRRRCRKIYWRVRSTDELRRKHRVILATKYRIKLTNNHRINLTIQKRIVAKGNLCQGEFIALKYLFAKKNRDVKEN